MSIYATAKQFAAMLAAHATPDSTSPQGAFLHDGHNSGGAIGVYDFGDAWSVYFRVNTGDPNNRTVYLASERDPTRSRSFKTFEAAWRAINDACATAGIRRPTVHVA